MAAERIQKAGNDALEGAQSAARTVQGSSAYQAFVKVGLVAYGLIHFLVAAVIARLATGDSSGEASNTGAIRELAKAPGGVWLLAVTGIGLLSLVVWQAVAATVGYREFDDGKRTRKRIASLGRAIVYGALGVSALVVAFSGRGGGGDAETQTARGLFALPGGALIVGAVGLAIIGYGVYQCFAGITAKFNDEIDTRLTGAARAFATVGYVGKGIAYGAMGGLFLSAAISHDPEAAGGTDQALQTIRQLPYGPASLIIIAVGFACFGVWCLYFARHAKHA